MDLTRILSIDWDYFFPNSEPYDMGHSEHHGTELATLLWMNRAHCKNILTGENLLTTYVPTIPSDFWKKILKNKPTIYLAESHYRIWPLIENEMFAQVTSLDAHHDCGYKTLNMNKLYVDCSNWAAVGMKLARIGRMDLYYPSWRIIGSEGSIKGIGHHPTSTKHGLPEPAKYTKIFVCRSGAWTPPWWDQTFQNFIRESECPVESLESVDPRGISLEEAKALAEDTKQTIKQLQEV